MRLVAEQVKILREKRKELLAKKSDLIEYYQSRDLNSGLEGIRAFCSDYNTDVAISSYHQELAEIDSLLSISSFVMNRDLDKIDIGTGFDIDFGDTIESAILVEKNVLGNTSFIFTSLESDLGSAVIGHKKGDVVTFKVQATGRELSVKIDDIKTMKDKYEHFILEEKVSERKANSVKDSDMEPVISHSQLTLLNEEYNGTNKKRREEIIKILDCNRVVEPETDDSIEVGSRVSLLLKDGDDTIERDFEFIDHAVSTEIDSMYVERISPLGQAIDGLKKDETFTVRRNHMPSIKGIVVDVHNSKVNSDRRVK